jgi:hypothetical protein
MAVFRGLGLVLIVLLVGWIGWSLSDYQHWRKSPEILGLGSGFSGNAQLPAEEIRSSIDAARTRVTEINQAG